MSQQTLGKINRRVLTALVAMGPCSNKSLAAALGWPTEDVWGNLCWLRSRGMATLTIEGHDATEFGREVVRQASRQQIFSQG